MNVRAILVSSMAVWLSAACSIEDTATAEDASADVDQQARVKDRVLEVVCDPDSRATPEELVPLVREVRARDGRSDRVWEVADEADCITGSPATDRAPVE